MTSRATSKGDILDHWFWAIPVLIIVAALSLRQIDGFPPSADEFFSMHGAGWLLDAPYSPQDVLSSLIEISPEHTPGYTLLLNQWGGFVGHHIAMARVLSIFAGLLSLALTYRLARVFVAPIAGFYALAFMAGNAFFNYYYAYARMYSLFVCLGALLLWLYLRIIDQKRATKPGDYLALGATCYALANIHVFSAVLFLAIAVFHVAVIPKDKRWLKICAAVLIAFLLFSPWIPILVSHGIPRGLATFPGSESFTSLLYAWLLLAGNGSLALLLLSVGGLLLMPFDRAANLRFLAILCGIFALALAAVPLIWGALTAGFVRLTLAGLPLVVICVSAGLTVLHRIKWTLGLIALLCSILAGIVLNQNLDWSRYNTGGALRYQFVAWHAVSRVAVPDRFRAPIVFFPIKPSLLNSRVLIGYSQSEWYFTRHGIEIIMPLNFAQLENHLRLSALIEPAQRLAYKDSLINADERNKVIDLFVASGYRICENETPAFDTILMLFVWDMLDCQPPELVASFQNQALEYDYFGARLDDTALRFTDRWNARAAFDSSDHRMSYQLINEDLANEAQLDLEMVHEGELRHFSIDVSQVQPGNYRLMLILYHKTTGDRFVWEGNPGDVPEMLELGSITIPVS